MGVAGRSLSAQVYSHRGPHHSSAMPASGKTGYNAWSVLSEDRLMARPIVIHADWDPQAAVWVATTQDFRGLVTEPDTIEALRAKLPGMILDLLEEHGGSELPASIEIIARASD